MPTVSPPWHAQIEAKRAARMSLILPQHRIDFSKITDWDLKAPISLVPDIGILTELQLEITDIDDATSLVCRIAAGRYTARQVIDAFIARAAIAHQLTNCLTEIMFREAQAQADRLDEWYRAHGRAKGPLHGLPISLKDQFCVHGFDSSLGFASCLHKAAKEDSILVEILRDQGAIIFCKTNVPQALMSAETNNNVWGRTVNPFDVSTTCGGSSGGEAALIAMKGSILGVGTDYGGSIRLPSALCGLYGLRPTMRRIPYGKVANVMKGAEGIESVVGPMARHINSIDLFMSTVICSPSMLRDPHVVEIPWIPATRPIQPLRYSIIWSIEDLPVCMKTTSALKFLQHSLKVDGHQEIRWQPPDMQQLAELFGEISGADGGRDIQNFLGDESLSPETFNFLTGKELSVSEYAALFRRRDEHRSAFRQSILDVRSDLAVDLIICPTGPSAVNPHRGEPWSPRETAFTSAWSILDLPVCVVPVPLASPVSGRDTEAAPRQVKESVQCNGASVSNGASGQHRISSTPTSATERILPVGIQLISPRRFQESQLLGMAMRAADAMAKFQDIALTDQVA